jgi:hypothetical protein
MEGGPSGWLHQAKTLCSEIASSPTGLPGQDESGRWTVAVRIPPGKSCCDEDGPIIGESSDAAVLSLRL